MIISENIYKVKKDIKEISNLLFEETEHINIPKNTESYQSVIDSIREYKEVINEIRQAYNKKNSILKETEIPIKTMRPTHVNRRRELLEQGFEYAKMGGIIDLTCGIYDELSPKNVVKEAENKGVLSENITISSDGYGSWSKYDENGNLIKIGVSSVSSLYKEFKAMVNESEIAIDRALSYFTSNVAKALEIYPKKGCIAEGSDADMIIFNNDFCIDHVIANGRVMVEDGKVLVYGSYE